VALRLNSVRRLSTIAQALGEERTRRELIPFLQDNADDDDEVLLVVAEELGKFVPLVGGPAHAHSVLPPLEALATMDETVVRDKAAESLRAVGAALPDADVGAHFVPLLRRLLDKEWTARVSAAQLFATAYPRAPAAVRPDLRAWFADLCKDETPMVRRAAAQAFGGFVAAAEGEVVAAELLPVFLKLTEDGAQRELPCMWAMRGVSGRAGTRWGRFRCS
jgi:serine/threonine-protein phosphatase 2A regulatory subunit A